MSKQHRTIKRISDGLLLLSLSLIITGTLARANQWPAAGFLRTVNWALLSAGFICLVVLAIRQYLFTNKSN